MLYIVAVNSMSSGARPSVSVLALPPSSCVTFGKLLDLSVPPYFIHETGIEAAPSWEVRYKDHVNICKGLRTVLGA